MKSAMAAAAPTCRSPTKTGTPQSRLIIAEGTLEVLKWLGLVLMILDHTNKFLFAEQLPWVFEAGRISMPLFGFVLAYNMARPDALASGAHIRTMKRLFLYGLLATPMFVMMVGWWPLNIMFMLLLSVGIICLGERGGAKHIAAATLLFIFCGAFVEFWWFAILFCLGAWTYCRRPTVPRFLLMVIAISSLAIINRNLFALAAVPLIVAAPYVHLNLPRQRLMFYLAYPFHLGILLAIQKVWLSL